jgi:hypothetical protein
MRGPQSLKRMTWQRWVAAVLWKEGEGGLAEPDSCEIGTTPWTEI